MPETRLGVFVSSVQKELAEERRAVKSFVESDPLLRRFFTVFLFEDLPASDRRADAVYTAKVDHCDVYVGIFGNEYGFEDAGPERAHKGLKGLMKRGGRNRLINGSNDSLAKPLKGATKGPIGTFTGQMRRGDHDN